jgi:hypothetical protein
MTLPELCVVDTNVPRVANLEATPDPTSDVLDTCILACVKAIKHVKNERALVIDAGDEIFTEYRNNLSLKGQPGVGDIFMKWVHDSRWKLPDSNRVTITKDGETFAEFPQNPALNNFDPSDRKFVAVANAHPCKPPILEAVDSDFFAYKDALAQSGITVQFVSDECEKYAAKKQKQKTSTPKPLSPISIHH